jgi:hypothetical protein
LKLEQLEEHKSSLKAYWDLQISNLKMPNTFEEIGIEVIDNLYNKRFKKFL